MQDKWKEEIEAGEIWKEETGSQNKVTNSRTMPRAVKGPDPDINRRFHCEKQKKR